MTNRRYAGYRMTSVPRWGRWLALLVVAITSNPAAAGILDCDRLSGSQHRACEDLVLCSLIEDSEARVQCVSAVLEAAGRRVQAPRPATQSEASDAAEVSEAKEVTVIPMRSQTAAKSVAAGARTLPRYFSATVTNVRALVRDRQVILLDNNLLFEGQGPTFKIGDVVDVISPRYRMFSGYTIGLPKGRKLKFQRLACEQVDGELREDTRRKCSALKGSD